MKLITKHSDYAIRALLELAKDRNSFLSARVIASRQEMPYQFLRKILNILINKGIVSSKEGGEGGFRIVRDPEKIKIGDIIKTFQGEIRLSECMFRKKICANRATCVLRGEIAVIEELVHDKFHKITIKSLLEKMSYKTRKRR